MRIGQGFDIHRLVEGRKLVLGGIEIPFEKGLLGHSDGDVLTHAIIDALLGAAGLGDIGLHFPPDKKEHEGANSIKLLTKVAELVQIENYKIINIDATVLCEKPKLSEAYEAMKVKLSAALSLPYHLVSVKAKTMEGLGEIGRGEAIAAQAIVLIDNLPIPVN
jgi:2-C-methyl-D-erythritol 2,4-cyclodiphosphate synthase